MRISGIEPSSVILSQTYTLKSWKVMTKQCQNKLKPKGMVLLTHKSTISINLNTENFIALKTLRINRSRPQNLATCALGTHWSTSSYTHQVVEIQIETSTKQYTPF